MSSAKKTDSMAKSILGILLAAVLLTAACPIPAYAAGDNQGVMDAFPALGVSSDTMNENNGTISTLYGGGTVKDNRGTISSSLGTVFENHGTIEKLSAGHVGTNYGTINRIENTGSLGVNDGAGTVLFVGMGNEVFRNDGTIQDNTGNVSENYGTVSDNYGAVVMYDGRIANNYQAGTVTFEAKVSGGTAIPAKGTINNNKGSVEINSGTVEITENTGNIEIKNATVTVGKNSGNITVGNNAVLICSENKSDGLITKSSETAAITCTTNSGTIGGEPMYRIVFVGDDGQAKITACDKEENGMYYTQYEGVVLFTLPPEYECIDGTKWESSETVNTWILNAKPAEGDTRVTISCHKCTPGDYRMTKDTHFQICAGCGKTLTETEGAHTFGEFVSNDDATCIKDGTETGKCTVCGYKRTRTAVDSHLTSDHHEHIVIDQRVEPTETSTGLTQGSHCEDCNKVLTAQEIISKIPHTCVSSSDYLYDGSTHWKICSICNEKFDEETHNNGNLVLNTEATCTEKATYYMQCDICGAVDHTQIVAAGEPLGHTWQDANCTTPRTCSVCGETEGEALGHTFENGICTECGVEEFVIDESGRLTGYNGNGGDVVIPEGVTSIEDLAFYGCIGLTKVTIPGSVTSIGQLAFAMCESITEVIISEGVTSIGEGAFETCTSLTEVTIPKSVTSIGDRAFGACSDLTEVMISEGVTSIGDYAFESCSSLTEVTIPESVTAIGYSAFCDCSELHTVTITDNIKSVGEDVFFGAIISTVNYPCGDDLDIIKAYFADADLREVTYNAVHDFAYSASGNVITATCRNNAAHTATLTLTKNAAENYYVYDGSAKTVDFATGEAAAWKAAVGTDAPTITYEPKEGSALTDGKAINAGNYTATVTVNTDKTATLDFTIAKATPYIKTAPAPNDIEYGQKLEVSTLFGGEVQISSTVSTEVGGLFEWTEPETMPAIADSNVTLYSVTFTPADTNNYNTVSCKVKIKVNHTHAPVKVTGQAATEAAAGWKDYYECPCGALFEDENGTTPIENLDAWKAEGGNGYIAPLGYTVTFEMNGHGTQIDPQTVEEGNKATKPSDPTAEGWTFGGWYEDAAFNVAFDFDSAIDANTTIYAKWTKNTPAPSGDSTPTVTVPVTGDKNSVKVSATVSGSTATIKDIKDADLAKVSGGESVEIDLTGLKKDVDTAKIPTATVEKIGEQAGMSVKLTTATVSFDKTATQEISDQAKGNTVEMVVDDIKEVSLNAVQKESVKKLDTAVIIDAYLVSNGSKLCTAEDGGFGGGSAKVILPYEIKNNRKPENYSVFYVNEAGKLEKLNAVYDEELKAFVFEIEHFSVYAVTFEQFVDIDANAYYYDAVKWAAENGVTDGVDATHFNPSGITDRAQMVTFLWKAAGKPEPTITETPFTDLDSGKYYYKAVLWAYENGITDGTSATTFEPNKNVSRAQVVTFLWRYAGKPVVDYWMQMTDVESGKYYTEAVRWALAEKITDGTTTTTFSPDDDCLRGQIVTFLYRDFAK